MKTKKLLGMLLALTMVFSMVCIPQAVVNAAYSDNVLLEYDFEDYTGKASIGSSGSNSYVKLTGSGGTDNLSAGETEDGNKYIYSNKMTTNKGRLKAAFITPVSSGKLNISFDIGRNGQAGGANGTTTDYMQIRDTTTTSGAKNFVYISAGDGKIYGSNGSSKDPNKYFLYEENEIYRIDIFIDLDADIQKTFVDGKLLKEMEYTKESVSVLDVFISWSVGYFDNLKIAKVTGTSFEKKCVNYENNTAKISFTESLLAYVQNDILDASDFVVTNSVTGETINVASVSRTAYDEVILTFADGTLKGGNEYNVAFGADVKNIAGNTVTGTASFEVPLPERTVNHEDFSEFKDGDIVTEGYKDMRYNDFALLYVSTWTANNPFKSVELIGEGTDGKSIRITRNIRNSSGEANTFSDMRFILPHNIYFEGDVALEYRIRVSEDTNAFRPYLISDENSSSYQLSPSTSIPSIWYEGKDVRYSNDATKHNGSATIYAENEAGEGFHTYKAVYHFDNNTADIFFDGEKLNSNPLNITNFDKRKDDGFISYVDIRHNGANGTSYVDIDYIKVTQKVEAPSVQGFSFADYNGQAAEANQAGIKTIGVQFAGNIDEDTFDGNITLTKNGEAVPFTAEFDDSTRTYVMTVPTLLEAESDYVLSITEGVKDTYGESVAPVTETISTGAGAREAMVSFTEGKEAATLTNLQAGDKVTLTLNLVDTTGNIKPALLIGTCTNGGNLSHAVRADVVWNGCIGTATLTLDVASADSLAVTGFVFEGKTLVPVAITPFTLQ